tara:strand:+ start:289 stop:579 length:291 start_codon:yes stop_codon:yes gene_type:complete
VTHVAGNLPISPERKLLRLEKCTVQSLGIESLEDSHPITAEEHNDSAALGPARQGESLASGNDGDGNAVAAGASPAPTVMHVGSLPPSDRRKLNLT